MMGFDNLDFTLSKFRSLCSAVAKHYPTLTIAEYTMLFDMQEGKDEMR